MTAKDRIQDCRSGALNLKLHESSPILKRFVKLFLRLIALSEDFWPSLQRIRFINVGGKHQQPPDCWEKY